MSTLRAVSSVTSDDHVRPLEIIPFDTQMIVDVERPSDLDEVGRALAGGHRSGEISRAEAEMLLLFAVPGSGILTHELKVRGATALREELEPLIESRLREKVEAGRGRAADARCVDVDRFQSTSAAAWSRTMIQQLLYDALRKHRTADGAVRRFVSFDDPYAGEVWMDRASMYSLTRSRQEETELDRQTGMLEEIERSLYSSKGAMKRMTDGARVHLAAHFLGQTGEWPRVAAPLTWEEREETRQMLEEADAAVHDESNQRLGWPTLASRSLVEFDPHIPMALSAMWDGYDDSTRSLLAADPAVAHALALAATTAFPLPRRTYRTYPAFRKRVMGLSDDVRWKSVAREVADAFSAVFVATGSAQDRASKETRETREKTAADGRARWDELMMSHRMPEPVAVVAATGSDLVDVLTEQWHAATSETES